VKVTRVGERWVLAGSRAPHPVVAKAQPPLQLVAEKAQAPLQLARTRGAAKPMTKKTEKKNTPAVPVQNAHVAQATTPRSIGTAAVEAAPKQATASAPQEDLRVASSERRSMFASSAALVAGAIVFALLGTTTAYRGANPGSDARIRGANEAKPYG
jgi:hypothetical protein